MGSLTSTRRPLRSGMTLVELLVVLMITVMLFALAATSVRPAMENRKTKEASRILIATLAQAKARAMQIGRPVGVWVQGGDSLGDVNFNFATELYLAETPLPYSGDFETSVAVLTGPGAFTVSKTFNSRFAGPSAMVRVGDRIRFNYRAPEFRITRIFDPDPTDNSVPVEVNYDLTMDGSGQSHMPPQGATAPYQVIRQATRTGAPIELPGGVCIDLRNSGTGPGVPGAAWTSPIDGIPLDWTTYEPPPGVEFRLRSWLTNAEPGDASVLVMFSPNGNVLSVTRNANSNLGAARLTDLAPSTIHFLIGKLDQMDVAGTLNYSSHDDPNEPIEFNRNLVDPASLWVSIGTRSGNATSANNNFTLQPYFTNSLATARSFARESQNLGAR